MAYVTNYTLKQITGQLEFSAKIYKEILFREKVLDDWELLKIFNRFQQIELLKIAILYKDSIDGRIFDYFKIVPPREDTKIFVFDKGGKLKYHLFDNCAQMNKDFNDFYIPVEIRKLGDVEITKFRKWFEDNNFDFKYRNGQITKTQLINHFNIRYAKYENFISIPENSNLLVETKPNSTSLYIENKFSMKEFRTELIELKAAWWDRFPCNNTKILAKNAHLLFKTHDYINNELSEIFSPLFVHNYGIKNVISAFEDSKTIVDKMFLLISEYIRWTYGAKEGLSEYTLDTFGLECCHSCLTKHKKS